ncbi:MAG: hypothetical protein ACR2K2_14400 [Mycobacteriales bacterium]
MPTVLELSAPYGNYLLPVRPAGPYVCFVCGTSVAGTYPMCYQCSQAAQLLPACADAVAAIALSGRTTDARQPPRYALASSGVG